MKNVDITKNFGVVVCLSKRSCLFYQQADNISVSLTVVPVLPRLCIR